MQVYLDECAYEVVKRQSIHNTDFDFSDSDDETHAHILDLKIKTVLHWFWSS